MHAGGSLARKQTCPPPLGHPLHPCLPSPLAPTVQVTVQRFLNLRYDGTDVPVMTPCPPDGDYAVAFEAAYQVCKQLLPGGWLAMPSIAHTCCPPHGAPPAAA